MRRVGQVRRRDANEPAIVKALEDIGAEVTRLSGKGVPDLLVRYRGRVFGFEVKSAIGTQTTAQVDTDWPIVRTVEQALIAIGCDLSRHQRLGGR